MALTTAGRDFITNAIINNGPPIFFVEANTYIGVGDSVTAYSAAQTDLQAETNKLRKVMDTGYPTVSTNELVFKSIFGTTEANYTWNEWAIFNASSDGVMLSRKVENLGTKTGGNWALTVTLTVGIGT